LPINPETIYEELQSVEKVVAKWRESIGTGIVGIDKPAPDAEARLEAYMREFVGELLLVSGKCQNMALILAER
jgi:hypothetical protein